MRGSHRLFASGGARRQVTRGTGGSRVTITKPVGRHASAPDEPDRPRRRPGPVELFVVVLVVAVLLRGWLVGWTDSARIQTWLTIFVSIVIQATPFVVLGTVVSAAIAALAPT